MHSILAGTPPIKSFPNDDKIRVVWAQCAIYKNLNGTTNVPNVEIMLKEVYADGSLEKSSLFVNVAMSELDIVRLMTIWKGNRKTEQTWDKFDGYKSGIMFSFNFNDKEPESIKFTDKKNSKFGYFPPYKYSLGTINDNAKLAHCLNSKFTKLTTTNGTVVLIPSLEFLTSTFTPHDKIIRNMLLQYPLEKILDEYINSSYIKDNKHYIELKKEKVTTNEHFLAYAKFDKTTQSRLKVLRVSCETQSDYPERYPVVLPYHPSRLDILVDGIWLDKETFFAFRVTNYSLPTEKEIVCLEVDYESKESNELNETEGYRRYPKEIEDEKDEIPLGNDLQPNTRNGSKHIRSEVGVLNIDNCNIHHEKKICDIKNSEHKDFENIEDIVELSSSESGQSEESKNVGKIKVVPQDTDKSHLDQSAVLTMVVDALTQIKKNEENIAVNAKKNADKVFIKDIYFVDETCDLRVEQIATQFARVSKSKKRWANPKQIQDRKKVNIGYRNYLLLKVILNDGRFAYIFESDRKNKGDSFLGLIFKLKENETLSGVLNGFLNDVIDGSGQYNKAHERVGKSMTFKHYKKNDSQFDCIKNTIIRAYDNKFF